MRDGVTKCDVGVTHRLATLKSTAQTMATSFPGRFFQNNEGTIPSHINS
jgi:hypothetical protein